MQSACLCLHKRHITCQMASVGIVKLLSLARVSVMEVACRDPRLALQGASMAIEGRSRPYCAPQKYLILRDPRKRLAFLASDAVL